MALAAATDERKFPAPDSSYLKTGAFVSPDHVKRVRPGLNKDQVRLEIGNPHFSEGIFAVHSWNYAFNFHTGKNDEYVTCQFMVNYDSDDHVASTRWKDPDCQKYLNPTKPTVVLGNQPYHHGVTLAADGLFVFGKHDLDDLTAPGRKKIDGLVAQIKRDGVNLTSVVVTGHSDRIGTETSNLTLSRARAETIRKYLVQQGLDGNVVKAYGAGQSQPVFQCSGKVVTPQLVQCLQPNRRVEIEVSGAK